MYVCMMYAEKYRGMEKVENFCGRFLRARKHDKKKAFKMIKDYLDWCEKDGVNEIRGKTSRQMLKGDTNPDGKALHDKIFPHGFIGKCKVLAWRLVYFLSSS